MAKFISYNVNGIRAALKKDWMDWMSSVDPDVVCLQETKASPEQLDLSLFEEAGYNSYWFSAEKKGYSSVAILSKTKPDHIEYGCGIEKYDQEGRIIRADYGDFSVLSCYFPSGTTGEERQAFKMDYLADFQDYINELKKTRPNLLISGDINICHEAIDIHNPVSNKNSSGFKPEERQWITDFLSSGFVDSFRYLNKEAHNYTWWTYRMGARKKNLGWRIDYHFISESLLPKLNRSIILSDAVHSDHCPILIDLSVKL
ncbi:exodeoxyribonuclease III [Putridiphycobacter roseus]|uniref:Exodeoxyribonuclease III n=1 Tax=Putridiphycobacter roseus TaxID=2219161 RepID=A0A2W1NQT5_9FLAO|nr:exodeoxyribonuclease III [Putridiphycobacter roseus]PZE17028.1 exodeoxyribonuclease III [Putridiphycobacter roseus]